MRSERIVAVAVLALALGGRRVWAQSYGPEAQVLTIGAVEFRTVTEHSGADRLSGDGYLQYYGADAGLHRSPLSLPEGARIEKLCFYAFDDDPAIAVGVSLDRAKLVPSGEDPHVATFASVSSESDGGYQYSCSAPLSFTFRSRVDVDGDELLDALTYYVTAVVPIPHGHTIALGGVQITWRRLVSPSPETPSFDDVPASDPAFRFVEALVASGITAGCGDGTTFCPDATLTRRQMAVFLAKALGLHWTD